MGKRPFVLRLARTQWGIENRLFRGQEVMFREDQCRVRRGRMLLALAAMRNLVITVLRRLGFQNIREELEHFMERRSSLARFLRHGRIK